MEQSGVDVSELGQLAPVTREHIGAPIVAPASLRSGQARRMSDERPAHRLKNSLMAGSFAPAGLGALPRHSQGLRPGLHSFAAPRLGSLDLQHPGDYFPDSVPDQRRS